MSTALQPQIDIRRSDDRFKTNIGWLDSKHSFSFSRHWDPGNTHHGLLLVNNDDIVKPGSGFETHPHRDMEIVTWVLRGSLVHQDSTGHSGAFFHLNATLGPPMNSLRSSCSALSADVRAARVRKAVMP